MGIFEPFSKRRRMQARQGQTEVYQYDDLPEGFRRQVLYILGASLGIYVVPKRTWLERPPELPPSNELWSLTCETYSREHPMDGIPFAGDLRDAWAEHFFKADTERALDMIEMSFRAIIAYVPHWSPLKRQKAGITQPPNEAIHELNYRFREHGIGYEFDGYEISRLDSQFLHAEVVKPALALLNEVGFEGAVQEFLRAHERYRNGETKEAISEAAKAFESTLKAIFDKRGWAYREDANAVRLIEVAFKEGLVPSELQSQFESLRNLLASGLPTVANRKGRHGDGTTPKTVPDHVAAYALHLCAANIVFLVESYKALA